MELENKRDSTLKTMDREYHDRDAYYREKQDKAMCEGNVEAYEQNKSDRDKNYDNYAAAREQVWNYYQNEIEERDQEDEYGCDW